ncbi:GNAT family N-acetyltransferase [Rhodoplanes tepidamans]|uniref:GNAT family N-acetyltransferase n=1 Tax=Rhodoplanes tepidamans TaxID=200616 RepID=A0ABT5J4E2_RHOTP|nr:MULTISPECIES: GNAT family N-acetyltransferase [Rhodoplanes]MDC7784204.1 GNAT family N-acetyltransferase [Rhodoplanes tepidamans]
MPDQSLPAAARRPAWRPMVDGDLAAVLAVAAVVHPDLPEDRAVFAERRRLAPEGCHVLADPATPAPGGLAGYVVSHPWAGAPPALDTLLGGLPERPTTWYLHDLALLPAARGGGAGATIVDRLAAHARAAGFTTLSLVAVGGSPGFWMRQGFSAVDDPALAEKLASYGAAARFMVRVL